MWWAPEQGSALRRLIGAVRLARAQTHKREMHVRLQILQLRWEQHQHELARSNAMQQQYEAQDQQWCLRTAAPPPSPPSTAPAALEPPDDYVCSITTEIMTDPCQHVGRVRLRAHGHHRVAPHQRHLAAHGSCAGNQDALSQSPSSQQVGSERTPYTHKQHLCIPHLSSQRKRTCAEKNPICDSAPWVGRPSEACRRPEPEERLLFPIFASAPRGVVL